MADKPVKSVSQFPFKTGFASINLHGTDRIRLLQFPENDIAAIRDVIKHNWPRGIRAERTHATFHEFKCKGNPWDGQGVEAMLLMRELLAHLFAHGWILTASTDVSRSVFRKGSMIFRKQAAAPPESEWVAISFYACNRLRLIGAPIDLVGRVQGALTAMGLCQKSGWKDQALNAFEFKSHKWPWLSCQDTMTTPLLLLRMLETLEAGGWSLYATVNQSYQVAHTNNTSSKGADSWYCVRAVD